LEEKIANNMNLWLCRTTNVERKDLPWII